NVDTPIAQLAICERQMVEIARAAATPGDQLIILDEPTSSLDLERPRLLRAFLHARSATRIAVLFISHTLHEHIDIDTSIAVHRNGRLVWRGAESVASIERLVELMGGEGGAGAAGRRTLESAADETVRVDGRWLAEGGGEIVLRRGEIIGLAGLEGSGQQSLDRKSTRLNSSHL